MENILFVTAGKLPVPAVLGGAVENLVNMIMTENEINKKYSIDVFTLYNKDIAKEKYENSLIVPVHKSFAVSFMDNLYFWYWEKIKKDWRATFHRAHFYDKKYQHELRKHLLRKSYNKIIVENNMSLLPVIYEAIGEEKFKKSCYYHMHSALLDNPNMLQYLKKCHSIICVSEYVKESMKKNHSDFNGVRFDVLLNTIDLSKFNPLTISEASFNLRGMISADDETKIFLYAGRISIEKGVREMIKAFEQFKNKNIKLVIAGGSYSGDAAVSDYEKQLRLYCQDKKLDVTFLGYVNNSQMPYLYLLADCLIIPSIAQEAGSLTAIEGLQMGIPMIVAKVGSLSEYLKDYPIYVEQGENFVNDLYNAMVCFSKGHQKPERRHSIGITRKDYFENFSKIICN